ncbi:MAG: hypothetical protein SGILL_000823 [Bacillariaceae sp.]
MVMRNFLVVLCIALCTVLLVLVDGSSVHIPSATIGRRSRMNSCTSKQSDTVVKATFPSSNRVVMASAETTTADTAASESATESAAEEGGNLFVTLFGYVKDSVVRTIDGTKEMWSNHGRCKEIRAKQKDYREKLKKQWEFEEQGLSAKELKERLAKVNGGITYDEFVFLIKGKEDRGKLMNLMFLMWGAPRFFPYALMFYPEILPSAFSPLPQTSGKETKLEKLSRERSHAVLRTLMAIEDEARAVPALAKLNIFGKKAQMRRMDEMDSLGKTIGQIMTTSSVVSGEGGGNIAMNTMENLLYRQEEDFTRAEKRLVQVPKAITTGIMSAVSGPNLLQKVMPHFLKRGQVLNHLQKLAEIDSFLVNENIDLAELSTARLLEACNDRMIGGPGRSDGELRRQLAEWLDLSVNQPARRIEKTKEFFNDNLARTALMSFYCVEGACDRRSASCLPRLLYSGQKNNDGKKR